MVWKSKTFSRSLRINDILSANAYSIAYMMNEHVKKELEIADNRLTRFKVLRGVMVVCRGRVRRWCVVVVSATAESRSCPKIAYRAAASQHRKDTVEYISKAGDVETGYVHQTPRPPNSSDN